MRIKLLAIFLLTLGALFIAPQAKEVEIKEVTISLYSRPVNGFRMVLDRRMNFVVNQIMKHVSGHGVGNPFQYEHTIIYENVRYIPVTPDREVSLYFLVRSVENQFTEVTSVVMYDYKRSVNRDDFPDLCERFLSDLSVMVRRITGDDLVYDNTLYTAESARKLSPESGMPEEGNSPVEHFEEEEVENNEVLLKEDPFRKNPATNPVVSEREKIRKENQILQDSIRGLNREISNMKKRFVNADEVSVSNEPSELVADLRNEAKVEAARTRVYMARNDSLIRINRMLNSQLEDLGNVEAKYKPQLEELRRENAKLYSENEALKNKGVVPRQTTDQQKALQADLEKEINENRALKARLDKLQQQVGELQANLDRREQENEVLSARLSTASRQSALSPEIRDSLKLIPVKDARISGLENENSRLKKQLEMGGASRSQQEQEIAKLQAEVDDLKDQNSQIQKENKTLTENLAVSVESLKELNSRSRALLEQHQKLEQALISTGEELKELENAANAATARAEFLEDSIRGLKNQEKDLRSALRTGQAESSALQVRNDSLSNALAAARENTRDQDRRLSELQAVIDSLSMKSEPVDEQQRFIREQWTKLENWNRELTQKQTSLSEKEKLLERRETVIREKEEKFSNLKAKEEALKQRESEMERENQAVVANNRTRKGEDVIVTTSQVTERGTYIPIFEVRSEKSYKSAQRQVAAYMNSMGHLFDEKFPDMLYDNILLPSIDGDPVVLRMRIEAFGTGSVIRTSVRLKDGTYANSPGKSDYAPKVEAFLREMFKFVTE